MLGWILFGISILIIIIILSIKPKEVVRYVEKDIAAEQKAKLEEEYRIKKEEMHNVVNEEREKALDKLVKFNEKLIIKSKEDEANLAAELQLKKTNLLKDLDEEIKLRKERNEQLKTELDKWIENEKLEAENKIEEIKLFVADWKSKQNAVVESFKKLDELKNAESFHRIVLSEEEKEELLELNKAIKKLRNPLPFRKAVYSIYYQPKINELCLRVVGKGRTSGIYKITHIESGKTYVGQSVDISNRWKQHAKRGAGADVLTANKLYPEMVRFGLESFQFEIVEVIEDTTKLNEAEKYWQEYFKSTEFGYSMR